MDRTRDHCIKGSKLDSERQVLLLHMQMRERQRERVGGVCLSVQGVEYVTRDYEKEDTLREVKWDKMDSM